MSLASTEQALPGFELEIVSKAQQDMADIGADIRHKEFTGEMLRVRYPGKYALAARAFFEKNRSAESICDILQISPQTMHALVETECAARGFSSIKARIRAKSASVALRTVSELQKLLDNPEAVRKAGIVGLTNALKALTGNEDCKQEGEKPQKSSSDDNSAADEFIDVYESSDGFWREKNPAPTGNESTAEPNAANVEPSVEPSAANSPFDSIAQSDKQTKNKGISAMVAKSADSFSAGMTDAPSMVVPPSPPTGAGGGTHPHARGEEK